MRVNALVLLLAIILCGCRGERSSDDGEYEHVMSFDSARVRLVGQRDTIPIVVQLAITEDQKNMGLMERRQLADSAGMLFVYDSIQPADAGFWMFRTRIPLDIAFIDSSGVFRAVRSMTPCRAAMAQGCPSYSPGVPYQYALEMNAGAFSRHGVGVGSFLIVGDLDRTRPSTR